MKSMTGFGRAELRSPHGLVRVEIKTTNHKFLEVAPRLPNHLVEFEDQLRRLVSAELRRGKVVVTANAPDPAAYSGRVHLNEPLARAVHKSVLRLRQILGTRGTAEDASVFSEVLRYPDVLVREVSPEGRGELSKTITRAAQLAVENLRASRTDEGKALERDFRKRLDEIAAALAAIERRLPALAKEFRAHLEKKISSFAPEAGPERQRAAADAAAAYVKNSDISEEVTRLRAHIAAMRKSLAETGELGRKLDFIAQEMVRETNTMGSKSGDTLIAEQVIRAKSAIEKIREQAQNVE